MMEIVGGIVRDEVREDLRAVVRDIGRDIERDSITCSLIVQWRKLDVAFARAGPYVRRRSFLDSQRN